VLTDYGRGARLSNAISRKESVVGVIRQLRPCGICLSGLKLVQTAGKRDIVLQRLTRDRFQLPSGWSTAERSVMAIATHIPTCRYCLPATVLES